jgi:hypothetical protein
MKIICRRFVLQQVLALVLAFKLCFNLFYKVSIKLDQALLEPNKRLFFQKHQLLDKTNLTQL